jgi:hypothetical protein
MLKRTLIRAAVIAAALVATGAHAEHLTPNTLRAQLGERPPATMAMMSWLAGTWTGSGLGGENEEVWTEPRHGVMVGMYRMIKDGKPVFYELLTLSEVGGSLEIRLKHFDANLRGWEGQEAEAAVVFPFIAQRDGRIYFDGITFEPKGDEATVYLAIEDRKKGAVREEAFRYRKAAAPSRCSSSPPTLSSRRGSARDERGAPNRRPLNCSPL